MEQKDIVGCATEIFNRTHGWVSEDVIKSVDETIKKYNEYELLEQEEKAKEWSEKHKDYIKKQEEYRRYVRDRDDFFISKEWRKPRYEVLKEQRGVCQLCGRSRKDGVVLHVDHIVPISKDWSKRLDKDNLQVLCEDCNLGKSNHDGIDWR